MSYPNFIQQCPDLRVKARAIIAFEKGTLSDRERAMRECILTTHAHEMEEILARREARVREFLTSNAANA